MTDFSKLSDIQIRNWLIINKVCIVTNSTMFPGSLYLASLRTYMNYIPQNNYWVIPGVDDNGRPFYGVDAFVKMINMLANSNAFDYVIYIDEDCFIKDFRKLLSIFETFKQGRYCLAGPQDGGVICHRNHSSLLINTFLSFWNIKLIRDSKDELINNFTRLVENQTTAFKQFIDEIKDSDLFYSMQLSKEMMLNKVANYRYNNFSNGGESPYCETVRNDNTNLVEPNQEPYSFDDESAVSNFEPYYILEEAIVMATQAPIYYLFATDLFVKSPSNNMDNSGLSSQVLDSDNDVVAYHTWFSRAYNNREQEDTNIINQTTRINSVITNL